MYFLFEESQFDVAFFATSPGALCQKDFSKGKKKFSQLFFPQHLQLLVVMQSVYSYKNIAQTLYTDDTYTKTQCCFLVMEGKQFAFIATGVYEYISALQNLRIQH